MFKKMTRLILVLSMFMLLIVPVYAADEYEITENISEGNKIKMLSAIRKGDNDDYTRFATWESNNEGVATIDNSGKMTIVSDGDVEITTTINTPEGGTYTATKSYTIEGSSYISYLEIEDLSAMTGTVSLELLGKYLNDDADAPISFNDKGVVWNIVEGEGTIATLSDNNLTFTGTEGKLEITAVHNAIEIHKRMIIEAGEIKYIDVNSDYVVILDETPFELKVIQTIAGVETDKTMDSTMSSNIDGILGVDGHDLSYNSRGNAILTVTYEGFVFEVDYRIAKTFKYLNVDSTTITIDDSNSDLQPIITEVVNYISTPIDLTDVDLTVTSSDTEVVDVVDNALVYVKNGSAVITVAYTGFDSITINVTVNKASLQPDGLTVNHASISVNDTDPDPTLSVSKVIAGVSTPIDLTDVELTITSSDTAVVNVVDNALVYVKNGSAVITVAYTGFDSITINVTVNKASLDPDKSLTVNHASISVTDTDPNPTLSVSKVIAGVSTPIDLTDGDLTITSNNTAVVDVVDNALVYVKNGSAVITVAYTGFDSLTINANVNKTLSGTIRINTLTINATGSNDTNIILTNATNGVVISDSANISVVSSDTNVVGVNTANKTLVYNNNGTATVTVTYSGESFVLQVTVNKEESTSGVFLTHIKIVDDLDYSDDIVELDVKAYYSDDSSKYKSSSVDWSSDDTDIARVNDDGEVRFSGETGWVTIKAKYNGETDTVTTKVTKSEVDKAKLEDDKSQNDYYEDPEDTQALKVIKISDSYTNNGFYNNNFSYENSMDQSNNDIEGIQIMGDLDPSIGINNLQLLVRYKNNKSRLANNADVKFASSNTTVANIVDNRVVFTGAVGSVTIGAQYAGFVNTKSIKVDYGDVNSNPYSYNSSEYSAYVPKVYNNSSNTGAKTISGLVINGKLDPTLISNVFTVTVEYENTNNSDILGPADVKWKSSNTKVARILSGGIIQFSGRKGKVTITCEYKGKKASLYYNVK